MAYLQLDQYQSMKAGKIMNFITISMISKKCSKNNNIRETFHVGLQIEKCWGFLKYMFYLVSIVTFVFFV